MDRRRLLWLGLTAPPAAWLGLRAHRRREVRVRVVEPGLVRGAWQPPEALNAIIERERIRTVLTLTAINSDDPKYLSQRAAVDRAGVDWTIFGWRGSTATVDQMARAVAILADPARRPIFFHCVGGHHRTGLAHAAHLVANRGASAADAWAALVALPWTRPEADLADRRRIDEFAIAYSSDRS